MSRPSLLQSYVSTGKYAEKCSPAPSYTSQDAITPSPTDSHLLHPSANSYGLLMKPPHAVSTPFGNSPAVGPTPDRAGLVWALGIAAKHPSRVNALAQQQPQLSQPRPISARPRSRPSNSKCALECTQSVAFVYDLRYRRTIKQRPAFPPTFSASPREARYF